MCHLQHRLVGFYNRDEKCLQRGTDWVFKAVCASSVKGLIYATLQMVNLTIFSLKLSHCILI